MSRSICASSLSQSRGFCPPVTCPSSARSVRSSCTGWSAACPAAARSRSRSSRAPSAWPAGSARSASCLKRSNEGAWIRTSPSSASSSSGPTMRSTSDSSITSPLARISSRSTVFLQLAHVARPVVALQAVERGRRETACGASPCCAASCVHEVLHQLRDVLAARAQRRHVDRHHVEPVEQVLAEPARGDLVLERLVGRGDDAHVHPDRAAPSRSA